MVELVELVLVNALNDVVQTIDVVGVVLIVEESTDAACGVKWCRVGRRNRKLPSHRRKEGISL